MVELAFTLDQDFVTVLHLSPTLTLIIFSWPSRVHHFGGPNPSVNASPQDDGSRLELSQSPL